MTGQMVVIYSDIIKGAGMISGGPYMVGKLHNVSEKAEVLAKKSEKKA